jgi:hypothetical protein
MVHATRIWGPLRMILHSRSSFTDLQPGSPVLADTRRRTESLVAAHPELAALRARIVWANPDKVVLTERYDTDHRAEVIDGTSHRSVCKPGDDFADPWRFVEHGRLD